MVGPVQANDTLWTVNVAIASKSAKTGLEWVGRGVGDGSKA